MQTEMEALKTQLTELESQLANAGKDETAFVHSVFFWTKEGVTPEEKADFAKNGLGSLTEIASVYRTYIGPPAMTPIEVVDNSYAFALICHFKNKADQDEYQVDPIHLKFIEDYKHLWEKVQVYDNLLVD
jgi:hypothetical protein